LKITVSLPYRKQIFVTADVTVTEQHSQWRRCIMGLRSLAPFGRGSSSMIRRPASDDPFWGFRREVDRLFDDFFSGRGMTRWPGEGVDLRLDVSETDKELTLTAELPGVDEKDVELTLTDDLLTIRGEKKREQTQKNGDYHMVERSYGSLARSLRLPFAVEQDKVDARFEKGVLTVTLPKPPEVQQSTKRIAIKSAH
jgi:HSP20 family protein